ncbi:MAG: DUF5667 domain-containing protein [Patescibacteria group bacterium]|jgi:hypothetical protein
MSCNPRELKELRRFPVPASALETGRERLRIVMAELPFVPGTSRRFGIFIWKPAMTFALVCVLVLSSGGVVMASRGAVPGERLYPVKLVSEGVQERLAVSPARKFTVQAAHAAHRLEETEKLIVNKKLIEEDRDERIQTALQGYEDHLFTMSALAVRLSVDPPKLKAGDRALQAAERMFDRHAELVDSATVTQLVLAEAVLEPIDMTLDLQNEVLEARMNRGRERGDEKDHDELEERHHVRSEKIQKRLRTFQFELEAVKTLENIPKK